MAMHRARAIFQHREREKRGRERERESSGTGILLEEPNPTGSRPRDGELSTCLTGLLFEGHIFA